MVTQKSPSILVLVQIIFSDPLEAMSSFLFIPIYSSAERSARRHEQCFIIGFKHDSLCRCSGSGFLSLKNFGENASKKFFFSVPIMVRKCTLPANVLKMPLPGQILTSF